MQLKTEPRRHFKTGGGKGHAEERRLKVRRLLEARAELLVCTYIP